MSEHTARKWSEEHRPPSPEVDALEAEYASKMTTRLRIFGLARKLEAERDALKAAYSKLWGEFNELKEERNALLMKLTASNIATRRGFRT